MDVKFTGYSERGMLVALILDLMRGDRSGAIFDKLFGAVRFKKKGINPLSQKRFDSIEILYEQSFSRFGTADLVFVCSQGDEKVCNIFIEAKVRTNGKSNNCLEEDPVKLVPEYLTIFGQLLRKMIMMEHLGEGDAEARKNSLGKARLNRKKSEDTSLPIGDHPIVLNALTRLAVGLEKSYFIGLVPDDTTIINDFWKNWNEWEGFFTNQGLKHHREQLGFINYEQILEVCGTASDFGRNLEINWEQVFGVKRDE